LRNLLINGGFALALVILTSIGWQNYLNITTMTEYVRLEHHTFTVVREFDALLSALKDVERGARSSPERAGFIGKRCHENSANRSEKYCFPEFVGSLRFINIDNCI